MSVQAKEEEAEKEKEEVKREICDTLPEDKSQLCKLVIDKHANMEISSKEAEKQLSDLTGEDIKLVEEPDWKLLGQDKDKLEAWATSLCMTYEPTDDKKIDACIDIIDKIVKGEETVDSGSEKIAKIVREDPEEVAKMIMVTAPGPESG